MSIAAPDAEPDSLAPQDDATDGGPKCEKCEAPLTASACTKCGWYPVLGIFVEVDEAFESVMEVQRSADPAEGDASSAPATSDWERHLAVWKGAIPGWGWALIGTTLLVVAVAVVARVATMGSPTLHMWCGVGGLVLGLLTIFFAHLLAFVFLSADDADLTVSDLIVKPLKSWKRLLGQLPNRLWLANTANVGLTGALSAAIIVGGVPYERLLDWGFVQPPKKNMLDAVARTAAQNGDAKGLDEAMDDFAGKAGVGGLAGAAAGSPNKDDAKPRQDLEALIIGYRTSKDDTLVSLLLAAQQRGGLVYAGRVRPQLDAEAAEELLAAFRAHGAARPFVRTSVSGQWLAPRFTCRVTYTEWPDGRLPRKLEWDALLGEIEAP